MARAVEYRGHSSVFPIFDNSHHGSIPIIRIKEEPMDDGRNSETCVHKLQYYSTKDLLTEVQSTSKQSSEENNKTFRPISRRITRRSAAAAASIAIETPEEIQESKDFIKGTNHDNDDNNSRKFSNEVSIQKPTKSISKLKVKTNKRSSSCHLWKCEICFSIFPDQFILKMHKIHYNPNSFKCRMCNRFFQNVYEFMNHRTSIHRKIDILSNSKSQCDYCKIVLKSKKHIQQHIFHYHNDEILFKQLEKTREISKKNKSPTSSRLNNSSSLIKEHKAEKRKRTKSLSFIVNEPIISHSINTRLSSERKALFEMQVDGYNNVTPLLDKNQLLDRIISPRKSISRGKASSNYSSHPPLVQIYAIPNEVEALLSDDCGDAPAKRMKLQVLSNKNSNKDTKIYSNSSKSFASSTSTSLPIKLNVSLHTPERISTLKEDFNCQNCSVKLEKLNYAKAKLDTLLNTLESPEKRNETSLNVETIETFTVESSTGNSTPVILGTVGIELENLDIALKKLETPIETISDTSLSSSLSSLFEEINIEHSYSASPSKESENKEVDEAAAPAAAAAPAPVPVPVPVPVPAPAPAAAAAAAAAAVIPPVKIRKVYLSSICRTRFTTQKKLIYHYLNYHSYPNYICAVCRTECSRLGELKKHLGVHCIAIPKSSDDQSPIDPKGPCENSKKKFTCKGCKKGFSTLIFLEEHIQQCKILEDKKEKKKQHRSNSNSNEATIVDNQNIAENIAVNQNENDVLLLQSSSSENQLEEFERNIIESNHPPSLLLPPNIEISSSNDQTNVIDKSLQIINNWSQYIHSENPRPKASFNPNFQHQCEVCNSRFLTRENLTSHIKKYQSDEIFQCKKCGTCFPSLGLLTAHKRAAHNIDSMVYKVYCLICDQGFSEKKYLRLHMMHIHNDELQIYKKFPDLETEFEMTCRICNAIFRSRKKFIEHILYYYNDRTVKCDLCGKEFYGQYNSHAHTKQVHYTKESYMSYSHLCNICDDRFEYESHLRSHILHFHRDRIVNMRFENHQQQEQQQHHQQNEQCYKCSTCSEHFITPKLLTQHQAEFSNSGIYKCNYCDRKCPTSTLLENHKKRSHYGYSTHNLKKCHLCSEFVSPKFYIAHFKHFHGNNHQPLEELYEKNLTESKKFPQHSNILNTQCDNDRNLDNFESWIPSPEIYSENVIEYTCAICDMKFKSDDELKEHMKNHKYDTNISENCDMLPYNFANQDFESDHQMASYESDDDTKYNFSIANICSVELEEYDGLYNPDATKEMSSVSENLNPCDVCHYNRQLEYSDHTYQKLKGPEATCNEAFTARNVKQTSLPHVHRKFSTSSQPELIKSKETAELPQKISTTRAQSSLVSDPPQTQQKKPSGACKIQTKINQYFHKSKIEKNISVLCDVCGLVLEKSSDLIQHKKNYHIDKNTLTLTKGQNFNFSAHTTTTSSPLSFNDPLINQKSLPAKKFTIITSVDNCTDVSSEMKRHDNLQNRNSLSNQSIDDNECQFLAGVDKGILYSCLQKP